MLIPEFKTVITFTGPSCSGKSTLVQNLLNQYPDDFYQLKSITTRKPRNEFDTEYRFVDEDEFDKSDLIQSVVYGGNKYGLERKAIDLKRKIPLFVCTELGILDLIKEGFDVFSVRLKIDKEIVEKRMQNRDNGCMKRLDLFDDETKKLDAFKFNLIIDSENYDLNEIYSKLPKSLKCIHFHKHGRFVFEKGEISKEKVDFSKLQEWLIKQCFCYTISTNLGQKITCDEIKLRDDENILAYRIYIDVNLAEGSQQQRVLTWETEGFKLKQDYTVVYVDKLSDNDFENFDQMNFNYEIEIPIEITGLKCHCGLNLWKSSMKKDIGFCIDHDKIQLEMNKVKSLKHLMTREKQFEQICEKKEIICELCKSCVKCKGKRKCPRHRKIVCNHVSRGTIKRKNVKLFGL